MRQATKTNLRNLCEFNGWLNSSTDDCRFKLRYWIGGFSSDTCRWFLYLK